MKGIQIVIGVLHGRAAAARLVDGALQDLFVAPPDEIPLPGAIYRAKADRPLKGLGGVFVTWPGGRGFLRDAKGVRPGEHLLVQVTGYAEPGKAAPVTRRLLFKSRYCILTPGAPGLNISRSIKDEPRRDALELLAHEAGLAGDMGAIIRSVAESAPEDEIAEDLFSTGQMAQAIMADDGDDAELLLDGPDPALLAWREWADSSDVIDSESAFEELDLIDRLEALTSPFEPLSQGASAFVEPTRALVAVDVNTGADGSPAAGLKANLATARALPRALRLRGLGGQITVDFAPFPKKDRRQVESALRAAFRTDPVETSLVGWTPLGHFELQRKRERFPLTEALR
ncbi:MAG: ribonuclease E/G [Mangrovicoccus sp.]|nr:ribonuclease E/G [Mangrovicoccus sp.]